MSDEHEKQVQDWRDRVDALPPLRENMPMHEWTRTALELTRIMLEMAEAQLKDGKP